MTQTPARAFAAAAASLVEDDDLADTLSRLLRSCAEALRVSAVAVMVKDASGDLQLLSSTSHRMAELELYQIQRDTGPCIDGIRTAQGVTVAPGSRIAQRWPDVGTAIVEAGFESVPRRPYALAWTGPRRSQRLRPAAGASRRGRPGDGPGLRGHRHGGHRSQRSGRHRGVALRVRRALEGRTVIERAKGALAYSRGVDLSTAYELLVAMTAGRDITLSEAAATVIQTAQRQPD